MNQWPELTLALALAFIAAYVVADFVARVVEGGLRTILPDEHERLFVDRPKRVIRLVTFLIAASALSLPALRLVGYRTTIEIGGTPEALGRWLLNNGLRIAVIAIAAYMVIRLGSAAARLRTPHA